MTMQATNPIWIDERECIFVGEEKGLIFNPKSYGFKPESVDTGCWQGYFFALSVDREKNLYLEELDIRTADNNYPDINGVQYVTEMHGYKCYRNIHKHLTYSGKIIVADGYCAPVGFAIFPSHLSNIRVLSFNKGKLVNCKAFCNRTWDGVFD